MLKLKVNIKKSEILIVQTTTKTTTTKTGEIVGTTGIDIPGDERKIKPSPTTFLSLPFLISGNFSLSVFFLSMAIKREMCNKKKETTGISSYSLCDLLMETCDNIKMKFVTHPQQSVYYPVDETPAPHTAPIRYFHSSSSSLPLLLLLRSFNFRLFSVKIFRT